MSLHKSVVVFERLNLGLGFTWASYIFLVFIIVIAKTLKDGG